jgi:phage-related protein
MIKHFSTACISLVARLISVFIAVLILFIPVIVPLFVLISRAWMAIFVFVLEFPVLVLLLRDAGI